MSALVRTDAKAAYFRIAGVRPVLGDIFDQGTLQELMQTSDVVLHLATAIPHEGSPSTWQQNDRIRREGTSKLLVAAASGNTRCYVQQSITLLYGESDEPLDEDAELKPAPFIQSAMDMENLVKDSTLDWCILRGGVFYGVGTGAEQSWRNAALDGSLRVPGDGSGYVSLIHVLDMARAVVLAAESGSSNKIFNVVDDEPVTYRSLFDYIAAQEGTPRPETGGPVALPSLACSNKAIRSELGWSPVFSTYRTGLAPSHRASARQLAGADVAGPDA